MPSLVVPIGLNSQGNIYGLVVDFIFICFDRIGIIPENVIVFILNSHMIINRRL